MAIKKEFDITKSGPMSFRQLQALNGNNNWDDSIEDILGAGFSPTLYDPYEQSEKIIQSDLYNTKSKWGDSMWDNTTANEEQFQRLGDVRANNQWGVAKLGAGISKGLILAGTTFVDGTLGLAYGLGSAITSWSQGEGFMKGASKLWDNEISNAMADINKQMEEWLPNYRTQAEIEGPWYKNLDTMNFWADTFIKNLGFTVGAFYSGAAWNKGLKALKILKGGLGQEVVGSLLSAINEGRVEANHNVGDWLQFQTMQLEDAKKKALGQLSTDDPLYYANVALIENSYKNQMQDLNDRAAAMGNGILLANTVLLSYTNFKTFGKMYSQGAKNAFKNAAGQSKRDLAKRITIQDGKYAFEDITKKEAVLKGLQTGAREGLEEMNQAWISETMGNYKSPDSPDAYYKALIDEDTNIQTSKFLEAASKGFIDTYGNGQKWEEFVVGALTGLLGMPTVGKQFNSGENTYLGKGKWVGLSGGFFGELRNANLQNAEGNAAVNIMNQYAEKIRTQKGHFVQDEHFINVMNGYAAESNTFEFKNAEDNSDFAAIASYARVGRLNDLLEIVDKDFENISDEELESIARNTTRPDSEIQGWKNSDGSFMYETEEGKSQMRKELADKRDKIKNNIERYEDAVDDVRALTQNSPTITEDQITELAWLHWKIGRFGERYTQMKKDHKDTINKFRNILNNVLLQHEENIKEGDSIPKDVQDIMKMVALLDAIQDPRIENPLGLAAFIKDNKNLIDTYFKEDNFTLFSILAQDNLEYNKIKSLYDALTDITKIAEAAKTFNDRYKEFIEDPLKLQQNRDKLEHQSNSTRKNKQAQNLAEKINAAEKVEDVVDNENFDEALQALQDIEERTPEQEAAIDRMLKQQELDAFKDNIFDIVNSLDGVDAQVQSDVQTLLESIEKREDLQENSEIYLDLNRIYREEEHIGKSDAHRNSDLEDRMAKAQMAILEAEKQLNEKETVLNSMGNGSLSNVANEVETTGSDATTKVEPVATAGEVVPKTDDALQHEAEMFLSYLDIIDNTKKQELKDLIIEKVLKHIPAKIQSTTTLQFDLKTIDTLVTNFDSAFAQYIKDKVASQDDNNPVNPDKSLKEEQPQNTEGFDTNGQIRMYWRPSVSRLPIYAFDKTNPLQYFHENDALLQKHYTQPQITYIKAVGEYLKNTGAFDRVDNGLIKDNEKIYFATDPELNKKAGAFVILLVDENNNVLGNLPTGKSDNLFEEELDKLAGSYIGLDIFTEAFKDAYSKDDSKTDGLWVMPKVFSVIDNWMIGKIIYFDQYNTIDTIFSSTDSTGNKTELSYQFAIGAVDRNGNVRIVRDSDRRQDTVEDREINKPLEIINGQPYVLLSTGNNGSTRKYTAVPVAMKKIINDVSLPINTEIGRKLENIFRLTTASTPQQIVQAKESLQEFVGAKFTIIVKDKSVELKALNSDDTWEKVFEYTQDTPLTEAVFKALANMAGKYRYQMALKYINKKLGDQNYNDLIKNVVETNLHVGLNHTLSNWFTIRPLKQEGDTFKMLERKQVVPPKTTGVNPTRKQNAASDTLVSFEYKGRQMKVDTSDWNSLYFEDKGVQKKLVIRDSKGNLNTNSAKAAAYAFGVIQHQDMTKPYDTQWGYYNPTTLEFEEKPIDEVIDLDDDVLSTVFGAAEQGAQKSVKIEFTTEELQEMAENKGMFKTPLHKRAWEALTSEQKSTIIQNPIMFDSLAVKYNVKSKTFSVDIDQFIKDSALFRKTKDTIVEKWNPEEEIRWLGKVLPQFNTSERLQIVNALIKVSNSPNPEYAWGQFKKGVITIYQGAAKGTLYHEAFHAVTHTLLNDNEVKLLFEEAVKKYGDLTKLDLEENLAEDFRQYIQYEQDPNVSYIRRIFRKLKHFVQGLFGKDRHINRLFYKINRGNYANRRPSSTDAVLKYTNIQNEKELKEILAKAPRDEQGRLLAPNGKPSNLTDRQYAQVRTKAFISWFGDWINDPQNASKVVDENGEPMVVYHHTDNPNLSEFNNNFSNYFSQIKGGTKHAIFFTTNPEKILNRKYTVPVFLNLKTPFKYNGTKESMHQAGTDYTTLVNNAESVQGAIFTNLDDNKLLNQTVLVAYNPNQIKSATDNIGTFSRENNNIYYRKLETQFELQNLKDELQYIKQQLYSTETIPEVKELYRKWREVLKIKERLFYYNGDVQGWIDDNGYQDVAEPFMKNHKEGYVKAFTREVIEEKASQIKTLNTQYLKEQQQAIQNRIDQLERNKDTFISDEALSFQEEQEYEEIMLHYLQKTQFKNLTQEEQEFITSREISEKEYNDLTLEEREHLLFCR